MRFSLRKTEILRGEGRFREIFAAGTSFRSTHIRCILLHDLKHSEPFSFSIGFAVSKSIRRAVDRNRGKRLMREAYRKNKGLLSPILSMTAGRVGVVLLFAPISRETSSLPSLQELEAEIHMLLTKVRNKVIG